MSLPSATIGYPRAWRFLYRVFSRGHFPLRGVAGRVSSDSILVVMCLWNRPSRVADIVRMLHEQSVDAPIRLVLWNNNWGDRRRYRRELRQAWPSDSRHSVELFSSPMNMGGVARFFVASKLWRKGRTGPFVMLDDDQDIQPTFLATMLAAFIPRSVTGYWAWTLHGLYQTRTWAEPGSRVDYVGTGGCICDIDIVADHDFFSGLPTRYVFIEDLWMCAYAARRGWRLGKAEVDVEFVLDETNQYRELIDLKPEFYQFLNPDS